MKVYIGIDWSQNKHDLCFLNQAAARIRNLQKATGSAREEIGR